MQYSIKVLADLAGVTTRTLRYYDEIGLLSPANIRSNGYRVYTQQSVFTLQQILFYRELDVPLSKIKNIIQQDDFDLIEALENHRDSLQRKLMRYERLIMTVEDTLLNLKGEFEMQGNAYFEGFDEKKYAAEAEQKWGHDLKYQESMQKWDSYSNYQKEEIKQAGNLLIVRMVSEDPEAKPEDPDVQKAVDEYLAYTNKYFYPCDKEFLLKLADMWVSDPRFAKTYNNIREGGAEFARDAVRYYVKQSNDK